MAPAAEGVRKPSFTKTTASVLLDLARGLAASLVLLQHWRRLLFLDLQQLPFHNAALTAAYALCSLGREAVVVFFILSGYLISGSVFRSYSENSWRWSTYLTHRVVRLWVVLLPGLLLCALWDSAGLHSHIDPQFYSAQVGDEHRTLTVGAFLGNAAFLQDTFHIPTFGSDEALWSLGYEFGYYLLFPLGVPPCTAGPTSGHACLLGHSFLRWRGFSATACY